MLYWNNSDAALVRRALSGRPSAFEELVERYYPAARAIGLGITRNAADADDVAQDAFLQAYLKLQGLQEPKKFSGWLGTIARNIALRLVEKRGREQALDTLGEEQAIAAHAHADEELAQLAATLLEQLDDESRDTLWLHYFGGYSAREIAAMHGVSRDAVLKRLQRAREALGDRLLSRIGAPPSRRAISLRQKQAVLAAVATSGLLYGRPAAAAAASAGLWGLGGGAGAWLAGLGGLVALLLAIFGVLQWRGGETTSSQAAETAESTPAAAPSVAETPEAVPTTAPAGAALAGAPGQAEDDTATGDGMLFLRVFDAQNRPVAGADVVAERVEWPLELLPPAKTVRREGKSDAEGRVVFEGLPEGTYGAFVWTANGVDAGTFTLGDHQASDTQNFYLKPGVPVSGRLVDTQGAPIVGAYLYPYIWIGQRIIGDEAEITGRVLSDGDGYFRFPALLPGAWQFAVQPRDRVGGVTDTVVSGDEAMEVVLPVPGTLEGRCEWAGVPGSLEEARVEVIQAENTRAKYSAPIAADGRYRIDALMAGDYSIEVTGPRIALAEAQKANVAAGRVSQLNLPVSRGHDVAAKITDDEGAPASGVKLSLRRADAYWMNAREGVTGADGTFRFGALSSGEWRFTSQHTPGYVNGFRDQLREFGLTGEATEKKFEFIAIRAVSVRGVVRSADGAPVAGAMVEVSGNDNSKQIYLRAKTSSGAGGAFVIDEAQPLAGARIKSRKGNWASTPQTVDILEAGVDGVEIRLEAEVLTALEVRLPGVEPDLMGLNRNEREVVLTRLENGDLAGMKRLDAGGRCTFMHVPVGRYNVHIQDESGGLRGCGVEELEVVPGKEFQEVEITCGAKGQLTISGRVVDLRGAPIAGAEVVAGERYGTVAQATSGADGRFKLEGLEDEAYYIGAKSRRHAPAGLRDVATGSTDVEIVLEDRGRIRGRVIDAKTRQPIAEANITARGPYSDFDEYARAQSGVDGTFTLENVLPGDMSVTANKSGFMTGAMLAPVSAGELVDGVEFALLPAAKLRGRVTNDLGEPVPGAEVACGAFPSRESTSTGVEGTYELTLVDTSVQVSAPGYVIERLKVPATGGEQDVVLQPNGRIVGEVIGWEAVQHLSVSGSFSDGSSLGADPVDGKFTLSAPAGVATVQLHLSKPMEGRPGSYQMVRSLSKTVEVVARGEAAVQFDLTKKGGASLRVLLVGAEGLEDVRMSLSQREDAGGNSVTATAMSASEFHFEDVYPGQYRLYFSGRDGQGHFNREMTVDVAAGVNPPIELRLGEATGSLVVHVTGGDLKSVGLSLRMGDESGSLDRGGAPVDDGRVVFQELPVGRGGVTVSGGGLQGAKAVASFEIRAGETTEVTLDLSGKAELIVERAESWRWTSFLLLPIEAEPALTGATRASVWDVSAHFPRIALNMGPGQGSARYENLPEGDFLVVVSVEGGAKEDEPVWFQPVSLRAGAPQRVVLD